MPSNTLVRKTLWKRTAILWANVCNQSISLQGIRTRLLLEVDVGPDVGFHQETTVFVWAVPAVVFAVLWAVVNDAPFSVNFGPFVRPNIYYPVYFINFCHVLTFVEGWAGAP